MENYIKDERYILKSGRFINVHIIHQEVSFKKIDYRFKKKIQNLKTLNLFHNNYHHTFHRLHHQYVMSQTKIILFETLEKIFKEKLTEKTYTFLC